MCKCHLRLSWSPEYSVKLHLTGGPDAHRGVPLCGLTPSSHMKLDAALSIFSELEVLASNGRDKEESPFSA